MRVSVRARCCLLRVRMGSTQAALDAVQHATAGRGMCDTVQHLYALSQLTVGLFALLKADGNACNDGIRAESCLAPAGPGSTVAQALQLHLQLANVQQRAASTAALMPLAATCLELERCR